MRLNRLKRGVHKVRVHHPLQQGLRLFDLEIFFRTCSVRVHHPLQQGLRRGIFLLDLSHEAFVRVHHPLQQGLRLSFRDHLPA